MKIEIDAEQFAKDMKAGKSKSSYFISSLSIFSKSNPFFINSKAFG